MKCDELKAYKGDVTIPVYGTIADAEVYLKKDVDETIAEFKAENAQLMKEMKFMHSNCEWHVGDGCARLLGEKLAIIDDNVKLKQKLEDANELVKASKELLKESQKMHQRCADNASKQIRRLKRALWLARANDASSLASLFSTLSDIEDDESRTYWIFGNKRKIVIDKLKCHRMETSYTWFCIWDNVADKCREKAEEYK